MMESEITAVLFVIGVFLLGVISPGPNFLIVAQESLSSGKKAGIITGLGVVTADTIYASAGLFGMTTLITQSGWLFFTIKIAGGLYITWLGFKLIIYKSNESVNLLSDQVIPTGHTNFFRRGLFTGLSNPKTVVFFTSIFATAYHPVHAAWAAYAMLAGIMITSVLWRLGLASIFSIQRVREIYSNYKRYLEYFFGSILLLIGLNMVYQAKES